MPRSNFYRRNEPCKNPALPICITAATTGAGSTRAHSRPDRAVGVRDLLAGLAASGQLELAAREHASNYVRAAREAGHSWHDIGTALGVVPGGDAQQAGETVAEAAFTFAAGHRTARPPIVTAVFLMDLWLMRPSHQG